MPELPEVETTTKGLRKTIVGLVIKDVWTDYLTTDARKHDSIGNPKFFKIFRNKIKGKKVLSVERRAKNILIHLVGGQTVLIHMKMTGHLLYGKYKFIKKMQTWVPDYADKNHPFHDPFNKYIHAVFTFKNGTHLAFSDARKFGKITFLETRNLHESRHLKNIGPEPLEKSFTLKTLNERLNKKPNSKIKTVLMEQSVIAGIGNIYSDEILWASGVHPERKVSQIKEKELQLIFKATKEILKKGINFGGDSTSDYRDITGRPGKFHLSHHAYQRTGKKCDKKDGGLIERKVINGRSAHFCPVHQK